MLQLRVCLQWLFYRPRYTASYDVIWPWWVELFYQHIEAKWMRRWTKPSLVHAMMTSWNGNNFRVTGLCAGNSLVTGEFPSRGPMTRNFDVFFALSLNKRLSKQSWGWWFKTPSRSLWPHCNAMGRHVFIVKPLPQPMLICCKMFLWEQPSLKFGWKY